MFHDQNLHDDSGIRARDSTRVILHSLPPVATGTDAATSHTTDAFSSQQPTRIMVDIPYQYQPGRHSDKIHVSCVLRSMKSLALI